MLVSWYLPTLEFSLWPCAVLLLVFIPVSIWHERNWRRTLADYAHARREAGAPPGEWPSAELSRVMGIQPVLVLLACAILGVGVAVAAAAALIWPRTPPGFDLAINPLDLPYLWSMVTAGTAAVVAGVAIAIDVWRNPWSKVARLVRRAIHASPTVRTQLFSAALLVDPELRAAPEDAATAAPLAPVDVAEAAPATSEDHPPSAL
ncbi:MAG: hypothetical protein P4L93_11660 [Coriobacteriia bacterium]|nr:hypothetical protein [Coriobacteriia bacterium]